MPERIVSTPLERRSNLCEVSVKFPSTEPSLSLILSFCLITDLCLSHSANKATPNTPYRVRMAIVVLCIGLSGHEGLLMASANTHQKGSIIGRAMPCQQMGQYYSIEVACRVCLNSKFQGLRTNGLADNRHNASTGGQLEYPIRNLSCEHKTLGTLSA